VKRRNLRTGTAWFEYEDGVHTGKGDSTSVDSAG
jgi:hypothetical protein